jgi:hypothetical protein
MKKQYIQRELWEDLDDDEADEWSGREGSLATLMWALVYCGGMWLIFELLRLGRVVVGQLTQLFLLGGK